MRKVLLISGMIATLATILDIIYHLYFLPSPLSPPLYFVTKFFVGLMAAVFVLKVTQSKNDLLNSIGIGTIAAAVFAIILSWPEYRIQVGEILYGPIIHLAHGIAFFLAAYIILRYFEP